MGFSKFNIPDRFVSRLNILSAIVTGILIILIFDIAKAQQPQELKTALIKMGRVWCGVTANGDKGSFDYRAGFFPNDYDILGHRGQYLDAFAGAGFRLSTTNWIDPLDTLHTVAIYGPTNDFMPIGKVVVPMTNYIRYKFPKQVSDFNEVKLEDFGTYDPTQFNDVSYDQMVEVTTENILGVQIHRKILVWSQNLNDNYVIVDVIFTNISSDTLKDFYINMESNGVNTYRSNGSNPTPQSSERPNFATTWQHYYGGRIGDTMRVFYEYSADDPEMPGDNMGSPATSQGGRLVNANFVYYAILHASKEPYADEAGDFDDFLQPKITYIGTATRIPYNDQNDLYGDKNYWAIRGEYSNFFPMSGATWEGTFHGGNSDELGTPDYSNFPAGTRQGTNSKLYSSFGPYVFEPGKKIHIAYASGFTGLSLKMAKQVGEKWLKGTLENPPNMPNSRTGWLPENFAFPADATEMDLIKDRWVSSGIDSVMLSAWRAKWNFDHDYKIPQAPPPPSEISITGLGDGVEIIWSDLEAEQMPNFDGYRIMRRISNQDTAFYESVYESGAEDKADEHLFKDQTVLFGGQYYYYIQAKAKIAENDLNADPQSRGKIIYSSRLLDPNIYWINPPHHSTDDMSQIRITPNPYNINDPLLKTYGFTDQRGIIFFNLPGTVTIKIYTENGDLVQTIDHDSPVKSGSVTWDMITSSQQVISSGVYIAVFQKPGGEVAYQKFLVVR